MKFILSFTPPGRGSANMKTLVECCIFCILAMPIAASSSPPHYSHGYYQAPVYYPPAQIYNNNTTVFQPYAIPLNTISYQQPTAVISGSVAYQQSVTTTATAGSALGVQSSVQGLLGAELAMQQHQTQQDKQDVIIALLQQIAGGKQQALQGPAEPYIEDYRQQCMGCHKGATAQKGFQLFDQQGRFSARPEDSGKIIYRLCTDNPKLKMPPEQALDPKVKDRMIAGLITVKTPDPKLAKKEDGF